MHNNFVYLMSNFTRTVLYTGVTSDLRRRVFEHKHGLRSGFTQAYHVNALVYYEPAADITDAIRREKQIKGWTRAKKNALVETMNPRWVDLSEGWEEQESGVVDREEGRGRAGENEGRMRKNEEGPSLRSG